MTASSSDLESLYQAAKDKTAQLVENAMLLFGYSIFEMVKGEPQPDLHL